MKIMRFNEVMMDQLEKCAAMLGSKGREYAPGAEDGADRLGQFKRAAALEQRTQTQIIHSWSTKHVTSIADMVESGDTFTMEQWEEKIGDGINYLILLKAAVVEEYTKDLDS